MALSFEESKKQLAQQAAKPMMMAAFFAISHNSASLLPNSSLKLASAFAR